MKPLITRLKEARQAIHKAQVQYRALLKKAHPAYNAPTHRSGERVANMRNILIALELEGPLNVQDICAFTRLHRTTVYRLLKLMLENAEITVPDRGIYALPAKHKPVLTEAEKNVLKKKAA